MKANVEISSFNSTFFEYLCSFMWFNNDRQTAMMKRYCIGATEPREDSKGRPVGQPIFWHINTECQITNGRIVTMDGDTGKVYDDGWYYTDGRPTCLFGEHLLQTFPNQMVALVKDEMTAAIMSTFPTPYLWLATGKVDVTATDLASLEGRSVIVFPDKGEYDQWQECLKTVPNLQFHISDVMEKLQGDCHTIAQMVLSQQPLRPTEAEVMLMRMEEANPNIKRLVEALDLEVVGISAVEDTLDNADPKTKAQEDPSAQSNADAILHSFTLEREKRWHGRNRECHLCNLSHEGINGTYCNKLHCYVEHEKGDCGQ